jgi:predicted SAM-dependent methyltransferase
MYNALNIGCGKRRIEGAYNIDLEIDSEADVLLDMTKLPWLWKDCSLDTIYMFHFLEHCPNPKEILSECHRILKPKGRIHITVPHSSSAVANGCMFHYGTYSYNSLKDYLSIHNKMFKTVHQKIIWLPHYEWLPIQWLIDLSPIFFERIWCYYVGGAMEVQYGGEKI